MAIARMRTEAEPVGDLIGGALDEGLIGTMETLRPSSLRSVATIPQHVRRPSDALAVAS